MPVPKTSCQKRLTATRAVNGFESSTSHFASPSRLRGREAGSGGQSGRGGRLDTVPRLVVSAPIQDVGKRCGVAALMHHVGDGAAAAHPPPLQLEFTQPRRKLAVLFVFSVEIVEVQGLPLILGQLAGLLVPCPLQCRPERDQPGLLDGERAVEDPKVGNPPRPRNTTSCLSHPC